MSGRCRTSLSGFSLVLAAYISGCAHAPLNRPLSSSTPASGYRYTARTGQPGSSDVAILLFFSGGGKRAAALSYGVLRELAATHVRIGGEECRLLDEVEIISSVSGGSFTAAYYCLYHDRIFEDFENRFLKRNINVALIGCLANPTNWCALESPFYGRSDLAAEFFDRSLFGHSRFKDLTAAGGRPFLIINATDMANGEQFSFSQNRFDLLSSDLGSYPVARAVAASSAVPILLSPITLKNYADTVGPVHSVFLPPPENANEDSLSYREREVRSLMRSYADSSSRPYIHLVDGVFSDNLGLRGIMDLSVLEGGMSNLFIHIGMKPPRKLVFVIVNAATRKGGEWAKREQVPGTLRSIDMIADAIGPHVNHRSLEVLQPMLDDWRREQTAQHTGIRSPDYYLITVDFEKVANSADRNFFDNLATSYMLSDKAVDKLVAAGGHLLRESPDYQRLLRDLGRGELSSGASSNTNVGFIGEKTRAILSDRTMEPTDLRDR